jgi:indole-3-glycerol phosphate synthase
MRLKICGITNKEDLSFCASYADAVGFIVGYPKSPRNISIEKAKQLISYVPPFTNAVVVIPDFNKAITIYNALKPDIIQLHGNENVEDVKAFRKHVQCKIIKACSVKDALEYSKHVDAILIDDKYGKYDLSKVKSIIKKSKKPVILAGHLTLENILDVLEKVHPYGIDVASGIERKPGEKHLALVKQFRKKLELGGIVGSIVQQKSNTPTSQLYQKLTQKNQVHIITEIKPASPSKGNLRDIKNDLKNITSAMDTGGVSAISVLVEPSYFNGYIEFIKKIRNYTSLPIIAKGFFFKPCHITEVANAGANAFLLMMRVIESQGSDLQQLIHYGASIGLDAMVEVGTSDELCTAVESGAKIIEINNREIYGDLNIDFNRVIIGKNLPKGIVLISASGIMQSQDIKNIYNKSNSRVNAVLIGTSVMQSDNPKIMVKKFVQAGKEVLT